MEYTRFSSYSLFKQEAEESNRSISKGMETMECKRFSSYSLFKQEAEESNRSCTQHSVLARYICDHHAKRGLLAKFCEMELQIP